MGCKYVKFPRMWRSLCWRKKEGTLVSTYRVALYLLDRANLEHVPLSTAALKKRGVSRASKWRAVGAT